MPHVPGSYQGCCATSVSVRSPRRALTSHLRVLLLDPFAVKAIGPEAAFARISWVILSAVDTLGGVRTVLTHWCAWFGLIARVAAPSELTMIGLLVRASTDRAAEQMLPAPIIRVSPCPAHRDRMEIYQL